MTGKAIPSLYHLSSIRIASSFPLPPFLFITHPPFLSFSLPHSLSLSSFSIRAFSIFITLGVSHHLFPSLPISSSSLLLPHIAFFSQNIQVNNSSYTIFLIINKIYKFIKWPTLIMLWMKSTNKGKILHLFDSIDLLFVFVYNSQNKIEHTSILLQLDPFQLDPSSTLSSLPFLFSLIAMKLMIFSTLHLTIHSLELT